MDMDSSVEQLVAATVGGNDMLATRELDDQPRRAVQRGAADQRELYVRLGDIAAGTSVGLVSIEERSRWKAVSCPAHSESRGSLPA